MKGAAAENLVEKYFLIKTREGLTSAFQSTSWKINAIRKLKDEENYKNAQFILNNTV